MVAPSRKETTTTSDAALASSARRSTSVAPRWLTRMAADETSARCTMASSKSRASRASAASGSCELTVSGGSAAAFRYSSAVVALNNSRTRSRAAASLALSSEPRSSDWVNS